MVYRQRATTVQDKHTRCNLIKHGTRVFVTSSHNHTNYSLFTDSCFLSAGRGIRPSWYIAKTDIMIYCQNGHHDLLQKCNRSLSAVAICFISNINLVNFFTKYQSRILPYLKTFGRRRFHIYDGTFASWIGKLYGYVECAQHGRGVKT